MANEIRVYDILPDWKEDPTNDPDGILRSLFDAVGEEISRQRDEVAAFTLLIDVDGLNYTFIHEAGFLFNFNFNPEQLVVASSSSDGRSVTFEDFGVTSGVDGFFTGYALRALTQEEQGGTPNVLSNEYARIVAYDGTLKVATVDPPFSRASPVVGFELCYPRQSFLPVIDDTVELSTSGKIQEAHTDTAKVVLPWQFDGHQPVSQTDDFYNGYEIEITGGVGQGQKRTILDYAGSTRQATVTPAWGVKPDATSQVRLTVGRKLLDVTDYYKGYYLRVVGGVGSSPIQTRRIVRSSPKRGAGGDVLCHVLQLDRPWDFPPPATSRYGITRSFVSLEYLAQEVGYQLESTDPEPLQRAQIASAPNFYKLRGTLQAYQLLFRSLGFDADIKEVASAPVHAPTDEPGVCESIHYEQTEVSIGRPHRIEMVLLREVFRERFDVGDFSNFTDTTTTGSGALTVDDGLAIFTVGGTPGVALARKVQTVPVIPPGRGAVLDLEIALTSDQGNTETLLIAQFSDEDPTPNTVQVIVQNADLELALQGGDFGGPVATGYRLTQGKIHKIRFRVLPYDSQTPTSNGILQLYLDGDLIYDGFLVDTIGESEKVESFSVGLSTTDPLSATAVVDNVVLRIPQNRLIDSGGGEDDVAGLMEGKCTPAAVDRNDGLRIPDSDLRVFLRQVHPDVPFSRDVFQKILQRLEEVRPIHVEVAIIGSVLPIEDGVAVADLFTFDPLLSIADGAAVSDVLEANLSAVIISDGVAIRDELVIEGGGEYWTTAEVPWGGGHWR